MRFNLFSRTGFVLLSALVLIFAARSPAAPVPTFNYTPVAPGLDYCHYTEASHPWSVHIARVDRSHTELQLVATHAQGRIAALGTVVSQISAIPAGEGIPLAGVNADFFVIAKGPYQGDPLGLQIINGELGSAAGGATFWIDPAGGYHVHHVTSEISMTTPHGIKLPVGLNEFRKDNQAVLYTPAFSISTRTTNGFELVLEALPGQPWLPLAVDKTYSARVREVRSTPDSPLTPETMVLSFSPQLKARFSGIAVGETLQISTATRPEVGHPAQAVGGRPVLMENGKILSLPSDLIKSTNNPGTMVLIRNPRTSLGFNGHYLYLMVVDGRQKTLSMGMTFQEIAKFMKDLGCTDAINLDGGGSTTFWLNGKVLNSPSDKHERTVANALVLVKKPTH